jgi:hypothetical protein
MNKHFAASLAVASVVIATAKARVPDDGLACGECFLLPPTVISALGFGQGSA